MPDIIMRKTSDLVSGIEDPKERRKYSLRLSSYFRRLIKKDRKDWPRVIADLHRDGREYMVYFRVEEPQERRKRKALMEMIVENYDGGSHGSN